MKDTEKIIICPACKSKMTKIPIPEHNFNLDICTEGCGGIWFENRELKYFEEQNDNLEPIEKALENKTFKKVCIEQKRTCPICGVKMVKNFTGATETIQIDECYSCGGKFFDYNEIIRMREEYKDNTERSQAALELFNKIYGAEVRAHQKKLKSITPVEKRRTIDFRAKNLIDFILYRM